MNFIKEMNSRRTAILVFAFAFLYQLLCITRGFDMTDEGFLMSLYQFFGEDPSAFPGGAGYPLSCYIGWLIHNIWPTGGILWVRFVGVLMVTATMYMSYYLIRKFTSSRLALLGLLLQAIFLTSDPKPFGYNNASAFVYIAVAGLLVAAETSGKILPLILSALLGGIGVYLRLPNLAFIGLCILPFVNNGVSWKALTRSIVFAVCFVGGVAVGWALMKVIGADSMILEFFSSLGGTLEGESTHSSSAMMRTYLSNYAGSVEQLLIVCGTVLIIALLLKKNKCLWPVIILPLLILYRQLYITTNAGVLNETTSMLFNGIGILGCCLAFRKGNKLNVIPAAALLFSVLAPFGSDKGFTTMWIGTWLALPLGISSIYDELSLNKKNYYKIAVLLCLLLVLSTTLFYSFRHAYYDGGSRFEKTASIESIYAKGIKAKPRDAKIVNEVLAEMSELGVEERDTILVFDSSPMLYFLTHTYPFDGVYWPCLQYGNQYVKTLGKAAADQRAPKLIVIQRFYNLGNGIGWGKPDRNYFACRYDGEMATKSMKKAVAKFIETHQYKKVWSNRYYDIYSE